MDIKIANFYTTSITTTIVFAVAVVAAIAVGDGDRVTAVTVTTIYRRLAIEILHCMCQRLAQIDNQHRFTRVTSILQAAEWMDIGMVYNIYNLMFDIT